MKRQIPERRRFPRAVFPCKIVIGSGHQELASYTENIGVGGIRIILEEQLKCSMRVGIKLYLRKDKPIRCEGKIIWVMQRVSPNIKKPIMFYTGVEFTTIDNSDREHIKNVVDDILSKKEDSQKSI